jgi:multidrug efflux system outer membrane protein
MRLRNGSVSQLEWLEAQRLELHSRRQLWQAQAAQYQTSVALVRALGGGWD